MVAVSLDVENAFNSIPWAVINEALKRKGFPMYIVDIIKNYLSHRFIEFMDGKGCLVQRQVKAGVPQGSVLGPVLWNIGYDCVLQVGEDDGCRVICYADDTLILAKADNINTAVARANTQVAGVLNRIRRIGLRVAVGMTEAVCFIGKHKAPRSPVLCVDGVQIPTKASMKYLGVLMDAKLNFGDHVKYVDQKVGSVARSLGRLMPNLRGPRERCRQLYAQVLISIVLYAAPVWSQAVSTSRRIRGELNGVVKSMCIRVVAAYRTVSLDAASLLARIPPHAPFSANACESICEA